MSLQDLTDPPTAPSRSDDPDLFIERADAFVAWFATFVSEMSTLTAQLEATAALIAVAPAYADTLLKTIADSNLTPAADRGIYFTSGSAAALFNLTSVARTLLAQSSQANMRTTGLGLGTAATSNTGDFDAAGAASAAVSTHVAAGDPHSQYLLDSAVSAFALTLLDDVDAAAARTTLGVSALSVSSNSDGICISVPIGGTTYKFQWGRVTAGANTTGTVTFPEAFTDATKVSAVMNGTSDPTGFGAVSRGPTIYSISTTTASWSNGDDSSATGFWMAIGY